MNEDLRRLLLIVSVIAFQSLIARDVSLLNDGWYFRLVTKIEKSAYLLGYDMGVGDSEWTNMDIAINGVSVEKGFSPGLGSEGKTLVRRRYQTSSPDGIVRITFGRARGSTHLSAVKIRKL